MTSDANPVISVIVPARNEEACLGLCLGSLVAQTGIAFELIVVDDASTDRTAEIARSLVTREGTTSSRAEKPGSFPQLDDSLANHPAGLGAAGSSASGTAEGRALPNLPNATGSSPSVDARGNPDTAVATGRGRGGPNVTVISAPPLPDNWTGKNNAMSAGTKIARGKWLLFTDADTVHKPGSLARAVAEAEQHGAALLSYSPEQEVHSFWEKAVMPVIFAELAATYPPKKVNDPASPVAAANGQYLLISREAYEAVGGHIKIANDLLEDVAMARLVKSSSRKIFFRYGGDAVRTRMYRSWAQMKEGWTKNLALLFAKPAELALERIGEFIFPPVALYMVLEGVLWQRAPLPRIPAAWQRAYVLAVGSWVAVWLVAGFVRRIRNAHFPWSNIARAYLGLPVFAYFLLRSRRSVKRARLDWKDRTYVYTAAEIETLKNKRAIRGI